MSKKRVYVAFTSNNARVFVNPPSHIASKLLSIPGTLVDPDMKAVVAYAPQYWKNKNHKLVPLNYQERLVRSHIIATDGADNDIFNVKPMTWNDKVFVLARVYRRPVMIGIVTSLAFLTWMVF